MSVGEQNHKKAEALCVALDGGSNTSGQSKIYDSRVLHMYPSDMGFSTRAANAICGTYDTGVIFFLGQVLAKSEKELIDRPGIGKVVLEEIKATLAKHGFSLKTDTHCMVSNVNYETTEGFRIYPGYSDPEIGKLVSPGVILNFSNAQDASNFAAKAKSILVAKGKIPADVILKNRNPNSDLLSSNRLPTYPVYVSEAALDILTLPENLLAFAPSKNRSVAEGKY